MAAPMQAEHDGADEEDDGVDEELKREILRQIEFYFSDDNLPMVRELVARRHLTGGEEHRYVMNSRRRVLPAGEGRVKWIMGSTRYAPGIDWCPMGFALCFGAGLNSSALGRGIYSRQWKMFSVLVRSPTHWSPHPPNTTGMDIALGCAINGDAQGILASQHRSNRNNVLIEHRMYVMKR